MSQFEFSRIRITGGKEFSKEVLLPILGMLGITAGLVALFYLFLAIGKDMTPVVPPHMDDGEMVDPNPMRLAYMITGFIVSLFLAHLASRKQKETYPAFWIGFAGGTMLWQSMGECSWHFSIRTEDILMCFPHIEGASALFLVILACVFVQYAYRRHCFDWGVWVFLLSFICNWFGHFFQIGTYPMVSSLMEEGEWYVITGAVLGPLTMAVACFLGLHYARTTKARLCCSLLLYMGLGMMVTGVGGL